MKHMFVFLILLSLVACVSASGQKQSSVYPHARRADTVDNYFGTRVADPYRWMENLADPEVVRWYSTQNALARTFLDQAPFRDTIRDALKANWSYVQRTTPQPRQQAVFYKETGAHGEQASIVVESVDGEHRRVLVDASDFAADGSIAIDAVVPSPHAKFVAFSLSDSGSDWRTWRMVRVEDGKLLPDEIRWTKFTGLAWKDDESGFYYSRHPVGPDERGDGSRPARVHFHAVGTHAVGDPPVCDLPARATQDVYADLSPDGTVLVTELFDGYEDNDVLLLTASDGKVSQETQRRLGAGTGFTRYIGGNTQHGFFSTTAAAPRGRVLRVNWKTVAIDELAGETADRLLDAVAGRRYAYLHYLRDARSRLVSLDIETGASTEIALPSLGTVSDIRVDEDDVAYFSFSSFHQPSTVYRYEPNVRRVTTWFEPEISAALQHVRTEQVFYPGKDGTRVPMFIVRAREPAGGDTPVLLYGYGGFDYPLTPAFSVSIATWLQMGGVYAVANLRGGGEYGAEWHRAGTRENKQNVFDDFIAAGEWLVAQGIANKERLVMRGTSNGGLLVGAVMTQRPDLFAAALPEVGVMDMLRYQHQHVEARQWQSDYGISENENDFSYLYAYSPYHNVDAGTCYPPTLVTTAIHDDRVLSWHSFKFAATLQYAQGCSNPILLHTETRAGHGAYKPRSLLAEYFADQFTFIALATGWQPRMSKTVPRSGGE